MARFPIIAVRNHFDPRAVDAPWKAYGSEATTALAEQVTQGGPGLGFFECLNFAFDHPDNLPDLHVYVPATCRPARGSTDTSGLLLLLFTYKEGDQGDFAAHLVAVAGSAALFSGPDGEEMIRKKAGKKYGDSLTWSFTAPKNQACVLVEPIEMASLPLPSLNTQVWGNGLRYLEPGEARGALDVLLKNGKGHVRDRGEIGKAAARQVQVISEIIDSYDEMWSSKSPPLTTAQKIAKAKISKGKGGKLVADDIAGKNAEAFVYASELNRVAKLLKNTPLRGKARSMVVWCRQEGHTDEHYDIESVELDATGEPLKLFLEVKSSKAADFSTVRISGYQVEFAEKAIAVGHQHKFVFVRCGEDKRPIEESVLERHVDQVKPFLAATEFRLKDASLLIKT